MLFGGYFYNALKKVINRQKLPKWHFLMLITFFKSVFKNTDQKNICVSIVFKAESKLKHKEKMFFGGFPSKTKNTLF